MKARSKADQRRIKGHGTATQPACNRAHSRVSRRMRKSLLVPACLLIHAERRLHGRRRPRQRRGITSTLSHPFLAYEPRAVGPYWDWTAHAGVDIMAHLPGYELERVADTASALLTRSEAQLAKRHHITVIPTLSLMYSGAAGRPDSAAIVDARRRIQHHNLALLMREGVPVAVGSDWFGETASREADAMRALGLWDARKD